MFSIWLHLLSNPRSQVLSILKNCDSCANKFLCHSISDRGNAHHQCSLDPVIPLFLSLNFQCLIDISSKLSYSNLLLENPPPGNYKTLSSFEMDNRAVMPKTNYYSFGNSATREQVNKVYNPLDNSPRGSEARQLPGPGQYSFKN